MTAPTDSSAPTDTPLESPAIDTPAADPPATAPADPSRWSRTTARTRSIAAPLATYLRSEAGSAGVLVAAIVAALVWANLGGSYERFWTSDFSLRAGSFGITRDLRIWVNSGLMTLFFLVVGLEARREFDLGDLRDRRRFLLPLTAGLVGMALPIGIFLAVTIGTGHGEDAHGWGIAMSTDTALALGLLAVVGRHVPDRVRTFLVTVFVVDDVASLLVVTFVYAGDVRWAPLVVAAVGYGAFWVMRLVHLRGGLFYVLPALVTWCALLGSGVDPIVLGLLVGLAVSAYTPHRESLENASRIYRLFREQPSASLARSVNAGVVTSISPNARLQNLYVPWVSYLIVPLFGLANAGIVLDGEFLRRAVASPITWGILVGYVVGKPVAVVGTSYLLQRVTRGRVRPGVGWASVLGSGTIAGIGFTVSFVVAALVFDDGRLDEAKFGVLVAGVVASALTWLVFRVTAALPPARRARALLDGAADLVDLQDPVDPARDHIRGPADATVTVVEYGDFQCPYCGQAEPQVGALLRDTPVRYVWRHLPLPDVHPLAELAAEASEAAAAQGRFWELHDRMLAHQDRLRVVDLLDDARDLGLDTDRFHDEVMSHQYAGRVREDVESADASGVSGTPTFFVNGRRHYGAYDAASLEQAVKLARIRTKLDGSAAQGEHA